MDSVNSKKDYKRLLLFNLFGNICLERGIFVLCLLDKGLTIDQIAGWQSLLNLGMFLGEIPTGFFSDIMGKKMSLLIGKIFIVLYYLILIFSNNFILIYISALVFGVGSTFISGTDEALLYDILLEDKDNKNTADYLGKFSAITIVIIGVSMLVGGVIQKLGWEVLLTLCVIGQLTAMFFVKQISRSGSKSLAVGRKTVFSEYLKALKYEIRHKEILILLLTLGINEGVISALYILAQDEFQKNGFSISTISIIFAVEAVLSFLLLFNLDKLKGWMKDKKGLVIADIISIAFFTMLLLNQRNVLVVSVLMLSMIGNFFTTVLMDKMNLMINASVRSSLISVFNSVSSLIMAAIFFIISLIGQQYMIFIVVAGISSYLIMLGYLIFYFKEKDCVL